MTQFVKLKITPTQWRAYLDSVQKKEKGIGKHRCGNYKHLGGIKINPSWHPVKFEDVGDGFRYITVLLMSDEDPIKEENGNGF